MRGKHARAAPAPRVMDALPKSRRYHTLSQPELHSALASSRSSSLYFAPLCARACVRHGRRAELAVAAVPWLPSPLMTHSVNQQLRLFLLYDRRTSAETKTTRAAQSSEPLPLPPLAAVAAPPQATSGRAGQPRACARPCSCSTATSPTVGEPPPAGKRRAPVQPFKNHVRDLVLKFEKREGSNCEVCDSNE